MKIVVMCRNNIKLYTILFCLVLIVTIVGFTSTETEDSRTNATPIVNSRIIIDAGHGLPEDSICLTYFLRM